MSPPAKDIAEAEAFLRKAFSRFPEKKPSERVIKKAARTVAVALMPSLTPKDEEQTA
jgi:hypothetical protein